MVIFDPQKSGVPFRGFREERRRLRKLARTYRNLLEEGHTPEASLLYAFIQTHKTASGLSTDLGAVEFARAMSRALDAAEEMVSHIARAHLGPFAERSATLEDIANETDPCQLLEIVSRPKPRPTERDLRIKERRMWDEAERNLIIAFQLRVIEMNDSRNWVSKDLSDIAELANSRLFNAPMQNVWMVAELDDQDDHRVRGMKTDPSRPHLKVFLDQVPWERECARLRAAGAKFHTEAVPCRVVETTEGRFVVWVLNRRKRERPRLIKFEREGIVRDSRGWKYVVVGVMSPRGRGIRPATREDAIAFNEHTRRVLWVDRLRMEPDDGKRNGLSDRRYWDAKTVGYYLGEHEGRLVKGLCEQIVTSIGDHISTVRSTGTDNHIYYAGRRALNVIAPRWFGHVGINWKSSKVRRALEDHWATQLPNHD